VTNTTPVIEALVPDKPFLRVQEVAELLGVPRATVYSWARSGVLRVRRVGSAVLVARPDLMASLGEDAT
jgi:excisionase family DNA binding protein